MSSPRLLPLGDPKAWAVLGRAGVGHPAACGEGAARRWPLDSPASSLSHARQAAHSAAMISNQRPATSEFPFSSFDYRLTRFLCLLADPRPSRTLQHTPPSPEAPASGNHSYAPLPASAISPWGRHSCLPNSTPLPPLPPCLILLCVLCGKSFVASPVSFNSPRRGSTQRLLYPERSRGKPLGHCSSARLH